MAHRIQFEPRDISGSRAGRVANNFAGYDAAVIELPSWASVVAADRFRSAAASQQAHEIAMCSRHCSRLCTHRSERLRHEQLTPLPRLARQAQTAPAPALVRYRKQIGGQKITAKKQARIIFRLTPDFWCTAQYPHARRVRSRNDMGV